MLQPLFFALIVLALVNFFFFVYNRYLLTLSPGPWKMPIHYLWFLISVPVPATVLLFFFGNRVADEALSWRPESMEAKMLFTVLVALVAFHWARALLWLQDRVAPEIPANLIREESYHPEIAPVPSPLPRVLRGMDTTGALRIVEREVAVPGLAPVFDGLTIAHVADVHLGQRMEMEGYLRAVQDLVNGLDADVVCLTGDFVDRRRDIGPSVDYHARFRSRLGTLFVMGNHDYWTRADRIREGMEAKGAAWLGGGARKVLRRGGRRLIFSGIDYPWDPLRNDWKRYVRRDSGDALVFLSHTPDNAPAAARAGAGLILSGHNHGGQFCAPFFGPFVVPSRYGLKYAGGIYRVGAESVLNVSRGVGVSSGEVRLNCPPEVCLLTLRPPAVDVMVGQIVDARKILAKTKKEEAGILANRVME